MYQERREIHEAASPPQNVETVDVQQPQPPLLEEPLPQSNPAIRRRQQPPQRPSAEQQSATLQPSQTGEQEQNTGFLSMLAAARSFGDVATAFNTVAQTGSLTAYAVAVEQFAQSEYTHRGEDAFIALYELANMLEERDQRSIPFSGAEIDALRTTFQAFHDLVPQIRDSENGRRYFREELMTLRGEHHELHPLTDTLAEQIRRPSVTEFINAVAEVFPQMPIVEVQAAIQENRLPEVTTALHRYNSLARALRKLPPAQQEELLQTLKKTQADDTLDALAGRLAILNSMFRYDNAGAVMHDMRKNNIDLAQLPQLLNNEAVFKLLDVMLDDPKAYRLQLGIIFSTISLHNIPQHLQTKMQPLASQWEFALKPEHNNWWLCLNAEPRLLEAMQKEAVVLVNNTLLVKLIGKLSGLALRTVTTKEGKVIQEGNWYSLTDIDSRFTMMNAFDEGKSKITVDGGTWALMRPIERDYDSEAPAEAILQQAKEYAATLSDVLPNRIDGLTRQQFRIKEHEER